MRCLHLRADSVKIFSATAPHTFAMHCKIMPCSNGLSKGLRLALGSKRGPILGVYGFTVCVSCATAMQSCKESISLEPHLRSLTCVSSVTCIITMVHAPSTEAGSPKPLLSAAYAHSTLMGVDGSGGTTRAPRTRAHATRRRTRDAHDRTSRPAGVGSRYQCRQRKRQTSLRSIGIAHRHRIASCIIHARRHSTPELRGVRRRSWSSEYSLLPFCGL